MGFFNLVFGRMLDKRIAAFQNELVAKHCDEVQNIYNQMRGWRHDYHNHIQAMLALNYTDDGEVKNQRLKDYLLDNAMEACLKQAEENDRFIRVYIGSFKGQLYISVSNSVGGEIKKNGGKYISTKASESHGFGLVRIDKIIDKYSGYLNRQNEDGVFATEVMLPL